jgi:hypothetical protein
MMDDPKTLAELLRQLGLEGEEIPDIVVEGITRAKAVHQRLEGLEAMVAWFLWKYAGGTASLDAEEVAHVAQSYAVHQRHDSGHPDTILLYLKAKDA